MDIADVLYELNNIYSRRGCGHTQLMLNGVKNADKAVIIASNQHYAKELSSQCSGKIKSVSIDNLEVLKGCNYPVALDNSAIMDIIAKATSYIGFLWKEKGELNAVNIALRSELNLYKNPIDIRMKYNWKEKIKMIWKIIKD